MRIHKKTVVQRLKLMKINKIIGGGRDIFPFYHRYFRRGVRGCYCEN